MIPIICNSFQNLQSKGALPNSFYEARITWCGFHWSRAGNVSMKININSNGLSNRNLGVHTDINKRIFKNEKEEKVLPIVEMQLINVERMIELEKS